MIWLCDYATCEQIKKGGTMKILFILTALFISTGAFASQINMHDHGASMNTQPVELVVVNGNEVALRSSVYLCPYYPKGVDGDVYECHTTRELLFNHLGDNKILELDDRSLAQHIADLDMTFDCANRSSKPAVVKYKGKNVYWFTGILLKKVL